MIRHHVSSAFSSSFIDLREYQLQCIRVARLEAARKALGESNKGKVKGEKSEGKRLHTLVNPW